MPLERYLVLLVQIIEYGVFYLIFKKWIFGVKVVWRIFGYISIQDIFKRNRMFTLLAQYIKGITEIDQRDLDLIFSKFSLIRTKRNEILVDYDEICKRHYFVNKGTMRVYTINVEGVETTRYFAFQGEFGTALPSLIDQQPAFEYLQTIDKSELLTISRADFYFLIDEIPAFALVYRRILENGFIIAQKRIYGFQGFTALEKVNWIRTHQPDLLLRVSNKMAASYLGISSSTLSRIKSRL